MKRTLLIALCFCFLFYPFSDGSSEEKKNYVLDGCEWAKMNGSEKLGFVKGWCVGGVVAFDSMVTLNWALGPKGFDLKELLGTIVNVLEEKGLELDYLSFDQMTETIDKIYSDPRVNQWEIGKIMPIVRGRLKGGWTEKDVDEVVAYYIKYDEWEKKREISMSQGENILECYKEMPDEPTVLKALKAYRYKTKSK